jgi:hypothetical protein
MTTTEILQRSVFHGIEPTVGEVAEALIEPVTRKLEYEMAWLEKRFHQPEVAAAAAASAHAVYRAFLQRWVQCSEMAEAEAEAWLRKQLSTLDPNAGAEGRS